MKPEVVNTVTVISLPGDICRSVVVPPGDIRVCMAAMCLYDKRYGNGPSSY